ncbi:Glutathione S-transferase (GST), C-terminal [Glarea lozoyensis ATCC 20868]|uniref:Glutathione S-transferase (GST), C-terminal n=2 Tax=Glarea lozoyensis TaxID=101852 RepID=S3D3E5_GLAL2|nr:Glutathione S-transferase (GST), C-terminal [Glarea lozoyensis ATCC 20868]EPE26596.1 Glutathione S-transferase (GST), C-terminal [Glarea lozoyensis ATCC 20868]
MSQDLKPLLLHAHLGGPNPFKVAIALEALGLPYTVKLWEFGDGPGGVKSAEFLDINENGRVPALEDPNTKTVSWESAAILTYILHTYDREHKYHPSRHPHQTESAVPAVTRDPQALIDFDKWTAFLISTLGPMQGQLNWYVHYNKEKNEDARQRYETQTYRCYDLLEGQLKKTDGKSILKEGYSAVDWHFYPWVMSYAFGGLSVDKYPNIQKWLKTIEAKREVKQAYEKIPKAKEN